ncbi:MAG: ATP-binding cassette domain-containing protein, partial [Varibaculum cambriense]|nr:ATP-binding cassette domain-containing protein [Varibaculum cambriense]
DGITAKNLRFSYGKHRVLNIPSLCLPKGKVVALVGPNGAGKTTLARTLIGLAHPEGGSDISFNGKSCRAADRQKRSVLVMQDVNRQLFAETVAAEVVLGNDNLSKEQVQALLGDLGLQGLSERHPMTLSGGQKQRLVIANALASQAELYVFDEPTSGVDYQHLLSISSQIRSLAAKDKAILIISHDLEFINEVADYQLLLQPLDNEINVQLTAPAQEKQ